MDKFTRDDIEGISDESIILNSEGGSAMDVKQNEEDVFTVPELASYLRMKPITIYKHVAGGRLPGFKVGSQWRFKKTTIDRWIHDQELTSITSRIAERS